VVAAKWMGGSKASGHEGRLTLRKAEGRKFSGFCTARPKTGEKKELVRTECLTLFASDSIQDTFLSTVEVSANRRQLTAGTGVGGALCRG
jgi:hypothetical protein